MARPKADPEKLAAALADVVRGCSVEEAAQMAGIGRSTLYRALNVGRAQQPRQAPPRDDAPYDAAELLRLLTAALEQSNQAPARG